MKAKYVSPGTTIPYTPVAATPAGTVVVQGGICGVAVNDIAAGKLGALAIAGLFDAPKAAHAIEAGENVYFDAVAGTATITKSTNALIGVAVIAAAASAATVRVLLNSTIGVDGTLESSSSSSAGEESSDDSSSSSSAE